MIESNISPYPIIDLDSISRNFYGCLIDDIIKDTLFYISGSPISIATSKTENDLANIAKELYFLKIYLDTYLDTLSYDNKDFPNYLKILQKIHSLIEIFSKKEGEWMFD